MNPTLKDIVESLSSRPATNWFLQPKKWPMAISLYVRYWGKAQRIKKVVITNRPF